MKILIIEDDARLAALLRRGLVEVGHVVDVETEGVSGETAALDGKYEAIVLDVMLPGRDGLTVARRLREKGIATPVLMLTARDTLDDLVSGIDAGADDYLRKPFAFRELEARLRSLTRREPAPVRKKLSVADVELDLASRTVTRAGRPVPLTARETAFLEYLMRNAGMLITRRMLEDALWEKERETSSNVIEVFIRRLRAKLETDGLPRLIHTVRGAGYRFAAASERDVQS